MAWLFLQFGKKFGELDAAARRYVGSIGELLCIIQLDLADAGYAHVLHSNTF